MIKKISLLDFKLKTELYTVLYYASQEEENKKDIKNFLYG